LAPYGDQTSVSRSGKFTIAETAPRYTFRRETEWTTTPEKRLSNKIILQCLDRVSSEEDGASSVGIVSSFWSAEVKND
jgi:hypothetical protein